MKRWIRTPSQKQSAPHGSVLVFVVIVVSILAILSATTFLIIRQGIKVSQNASQSIEAKLAADTGLNHVKKTLRDTVTTNTIFTPEGVFYYDPGPLPDHNDKHPWLKVTNHLLNTAPPYASPLSLFADTDPATEVESVPLSAQDDELATFSAQRYPSLRFTSSPIYSQTRDKFDCALVNKIKGETATFYKDTDNYAKDKFVAKTLPRVNGNRGEYFVWVKDLDAKFYAKVADTGASRDGWDLDIYRTLPHSIYTDIYGASVTDEGTELHAILQNVLEYNAAPNKLGETDMLEELLSLNVNILPSSDSRFPHFPSTKELATQLPSIYNAIDPNNLKINDALTYSEERADLDHYFTVYRDSLNYSAQLPQKAVKNQPAAFNINTAPLEVIAAALSQIPGENPPYDTTSHDPDVHTPMTSARALALAQRIVSKRPFLCRMDFEDFLAAHLRGNCMIGDVVDLDYEPNATDFNQPDEATISGIPANSGIPIVRLIYLAMNRRLGPGYLAAPLAINPASATDQLFYSDAARVELSLSQYMEIPGITTASSGAQQFKVTIGAEDWWPNEPRYQKLRFQFFYNDIEGSLLGAPPALPLRKEALVTPREFNNIVNSLFSGGDDIQNIPIGSATNQPVVLAGPDGVLQTIPGGDDRFQQRITPGVNGALNSVRAGDDVIDGLTITAGLNGILESLPGGDDVLETDLTRIWPGPNGIAETIASSAQPSYYSYIDDVKFAQMFWDEINTILPIPPNPGGMAKFILDPAIASLSPNVPGYGSMLIADADRKASQVMKFYYRLPIDGGFVLDGNVTNLITWRCLPQGMPPTTTPATPTIPFDTTMESDRRSGFYQMCFDDWTTLSPYVCGPMQVVGDPSYYTGVDDADPAQSHYAAAKPWSGRTPGTPFDADGSTAIEPGEDTVGNGDVSWSPKVCFRSRFFQVFVLGQGVRGPDSLTVPIPEEMLKVQGEKRLEAVYDALLDQIIWQRSPVTDKRAMGEPIPPP